MKEMHKDFEKILSKSDIMRDHCTKVVENLSTLDEEKLFDDIEGLVLHMCSRFMMMFPTYKDLLIEDIIIAMSQVLEEDIDSSIEDSDLIKSSTFATLIYYTYLNGFNLFVETINVLEQGLNTQSHA
nr:MAG TPA: hypothetical protein [Caudoviricetes sp.]